MAVRKTLKPDSFTSPQTYLTLNANLHNIVDDITFRQRVDKNIYFTKTTYKSPFIYYKNTVSRQVYQVK